MAVEEVVAVVAEAVEGPVLAVAHTVIHTMAVARQLVVPLG